MTAPTGTGSAEPRPMGTERVPPGRVVIGRTIRLVALAAWRSTLEFWTYRSFVVTIMIGHAVTPILGLLVWSAALPGAEGIGEYYVALLVVQLMTASEENHTLSNGIYSGDFPDDLVKPRPVVIGVLGTNFALRFWYTTFGLPLILAMALVVGVRLDPIDLLLAVPAIGLAAFTRFAFTFTVALSAFWTQRAHGAVLTSETLIFLLGGTAAPLALMPAPWQDIGRLLPFWSMSGAAADVASGNLVGVDVLWTYGIQVCWLFALSGIAVGVWRRGIRRFTAFGG